MKPYYRVSVNLASAKPRLRGPMAAGANWIVEPSPLHFGQGRTSGGYGCGTMQVQAVGRMTLHAPWQKEQITPPPMCRRSTFPGDATRRSVPAGG